jgi:hypothetical protein
VVTPDKCYPPVLVHFNLTLVYHRIPLTPHCSYDHGDYPLLYNILRHSDWSCVLNEYSVDSSVNNLIAMVREAITYSFLIKKCPKYSAFLHKFSHAVRRTTKLHLGPQTFKIFINDTCVIILFFFFSFILFLSIRKYFLLYNLLRVVNYYNLIQILCRSTALKTILKLAYSKQMISFTHKTNSMHLVTFWVIY